MTIISVLPGEDQKMAAGSGGYSPLTKVSSILVKEAYQGCENDYPETTAHHFLMQPKIRLTFLDGIRGAAILSVFLFHSLGASFQFDQLKWDGWFRNFHVAKSFLLMYPLTYGFAGVSIFFAVSGFCIHLSHRLAGEKGWTGFLIRRFFRIYPPYLLAVLLFFFCWPLEESYRQPEALQLGTHLLAVHNFDQKTYFGINGSFWSIAIEIQLYAIYPFLLWVADKRGWRLALIMAGFSEFSIRLAQTFYSICLEQPLPQWIGGSPFAFWFSWAIGAYAAQRYLDGKMSGFSRISFTWVALFAFFSPFFKPTACFTFPAFAVATTVAIDRLISGAWKIPQRPAFSMGWKHLSFLGVISYSFYLIHQPFVTWFASHSDIPGHHPRLIQWLGHVIPADHLADGNQPLLRFCFCCSSYAVVLIASWLIFRLIEQPSISVGKGILRKFKPALEK